jgi:cytochrome c peroxidase
MRSVVYIALAVTLLTACSNDVELQRSPLQRYYSLTEAPAGFDTIPYPAENAFTIERWKLGKRLFFDRNLSRDRSISCGSCHKQEFAFADNQAVSPGVEGRRGIRNSPSLANVAYQPYMMREGGVPDLERQDLVPIQEHAEFDFNILALAERLAEDSSYSNASERAYGRRMDPYVITRALSVFQRSLISGDSPYDRYRNQGMKSALTPQQLDGMGLFFSSQTGCTNCHTGFDLTDYSFQNNGLYSNYEDPGRRRLTNDPLDDALFKVPSLRNVAVTAPYMHDGSIKSLEGVVRHYMSGGADHPNKSEHIKPFQLSEDEVEALVAFLESLTDETFLTNDIYHEDQ